MIKRYYVCKANSDHQDWVNLPDQYLMIGVFRCVYQVEDLPVWPIMWDEIPQEDLPCGKPAVLYMSNEQARRQARYEDP